VNEVEESKEHWPNLPDKWGCSIELNTNADGQYGVTIELRHDGVLKCRMAVTQIGRDKSEAFLRAKERAERWTWEWVGRHPDDPVR